MVYLPSYYNFYKSRGDFCLVTGQTALRSLDRAWDIEGSQ